MDKKRVMEKMFSGRKRKRQDEKKSKNYFWIFTDRLTNQVCYIVDTNQSTI